MSNQSFITTSHGMSGHFAVLISWNPEGFHEPEQTGLGRYCTKEEAEIEAQEWAESEDLEFHP